MPITDPFNADRNPELLTDVIEMLQNGSGYDEISGPVVHIAFRLINGGDLLRLAERAQSHTEPFLSFIDLVETYLEGREELAGAE